MKYMLLIYADEAKILNDKTREQRVSPAYAAYMEAMQKAGVIVGGDRLQPTASATTVRARNGKQHGVGQVIGDVLVVGCLIKGRTAILIMAINPDGSLSGRWSRRTDRGQKGTEMWKKA